MLNKGVTMSSKIIQKFKQKHGDLYDYSDVVYTNSRNKVKIKCNIHGIFEQEPASHARGRGCGKCSNNNKMTTEEFIKKAKEVHKDRYVYDNVVYLGRMQKVRIKCRVHGEFLQEPISHIKNSGCPKCANIHSSRKRSSTFSEFILKAKTIHGTTYAYDKVVYTNSKKTVIITCPIHGDFKQTPNDHLVGKGCSKCQSNGFNKNRPGLVYYLSINNGQAYKIGITNNTVRKRFSKDELKIIEVLSTHRFENGNEAYLKEQEILMRYKEYKYLGPDLLKSGNTELFSIDVLKLNRKDIPSQHKNEQKQSKT